MASYVTSESFQAPSGAGLDGLTDQNALTLAGFAVGAITAGGAVFVSTLVAPGYVIGGSLATGTLLTGGHLKKTTGSFLPFLKKDEDKTSTSTNSVIAPKAPLMSDDYDHTAGIDVEATAVA